MLEKQAAEEKMNMNAPKTGIKSKLQATNQEIRKDEEKIEMWMTSNITRVKTWVSQSLATHRSAKLMGGVALGALMITVTGLQFAPSQTDDSSFNQRVMVPGAPAALAGFTPNQQVEILGEMDDYGFGKWDAYALLGEIGESTVANIVDPIYTVVAKFPKRYLPR